MFNEITRITIVSPYSFEKRQEIVAETFGINVVKIKPSFFPEKCMLDMIIFSSKEIILFKKCIQFIENEKMFLPNAHGLIIFKHFDLINNLVPIGASVIGLDYRSNLVFGKTGYQIPVLRKNSDNFYKPDFFPYEMKKEINEIFIAFKKIK